MHNRLVAAGVSRRPNPATTRTDISDEQIIRLYNGGGYTAAEIADRLGCSTSLVYARLARGGIARRPRAPRGRARPTHAELAHLYREAGLSLRDLAGRYRVSRQAVHRWLVTAGIDRRPPGGGAAARDDAVVLYQAGWSAPAIAGRLGCSPSTIYRRLAAAGVARRPVAPALSRHDLLQALDRGLLAPQIAATHGVSVSCVCRALAREGLMTNSQAARQRRRLRYPEYHQSPTRPAANVSVSGNAQR